MARLCWRDSEEIGIRLYEADPEQDPLRLGFVALHQRVCALPDFADEPKKSNEGVLEAIQMAWYEEWKADHG
jgi:FeS assembly protein IscX